MPRVEDETFLTQSGMYADPGEVAVADATTTVKGLVKQATFVADQGALTATAPAALTAAAAAGAAPDKAEFDALLADVTALRTTLAAVVTDATAARTKLNAALGALRSAANKPMATS
jgi:hypothetical protein